MQFRNLKRIWNIATHTHTEIKWPNETRCGRQRTYQDIKNHPEGTNQIRKCHEDSLTGTHLLLSMGYVYEEDYRKNAQLAQSVLRDTVKPQDWQKEQRTQKEMERLDF